MLSKHMVDIITNGTILEVESLLSLLDLPVAGGQLHQLFKVLGDLEGNHLKVMGIVRAIREPVVSSVKATKVLKEESFPILE